MPQHIHAKNITPPQKTTKFSEKHQSLISNRDGNLTYILHQHMLIFYYAKDHF